MLRGSIKDTAENFEMAALTNGKSLGGSISCEQELLALAEAVVHRDSEARDAARGALTPVIGAAGFVDACAVASAFQGFNRIADSVGTGVDPGQVDMLEPIRGSIGLDKFYRAEHGVDAG